MTPATRAEVIVWLYAAGYLIMGMALGWAGAVTRLEEGGAVREGPALLLMAVSIGLALVATGVQVHRFGWRDALTGRIA